ncbi:hypothetical protein PN36_30825 [Candidatus Thiomargarita nelsonii]|uniref:Secreted protein n=1 Tax=Candidatus Thiomargarita nelsonii TaxID=1003181 RepID=A0A0A6P3S9_9GAMM|nr:hypothetical protein PN36_30825 [Candidatus Thiomargarita nelsonii]
MKTFYLTAIISLLLGLAPPVIADFEVDLSGYEEGDIPTALLGEGIVIKTDSESSEKVNYVTGQSSQRVNAIKLRNIVGWVERERNEVAGRPTHHCYKFTPGSSFQRVGGCREALPTLQKKLNLMALSQRVGELVIGLTDISNAFEIIVEAHFLDLLWVESDILLSSEQNENQVKLNFTTGSKTGFKCSNPLIIQYFLEE